MKSSITISEITPEGARCLLHLAKVFDAEYPELDELEWLDLMEALKDTLNATSNLLFALPATSRLEELRGFYDQMWEALGAAQKAFDADWDMNQRSEERIKDDVHQRE